MKNLNIINRFEISPSTKTVVVGGGVLGIMAGIELAKKKIGGVEVFDEGGERATDAAGAQFLPLASGINPTMNSLERELLPIENAYFPCVLQGFRESQEYYRQRAQQIGSDTTAIPLMELRGPDVSLRRYLLDLMDASAHSIEPRTLEGGDGKPVLYNGYYWCESFGIDTTIARSNLKREFEQLGGVVHEDSHVTPAAIDSLDSAFAVIAAGSKAEVLRKDMPFPIYKKPGMSATYRSTTPLPELPMLSYDDLVFRPHPDGHGITVGGFDLSNYGDNVTESRANAKEALKRRLKDVEAEIGPWKGLPLGIIEQSSVEFRFGTRAVGAFGLSVEQDRRRQNIFHIEGAGSLGWSLAPWATKLVADFVADANENFTPGIVNDGLLEKTGDSTNPYVERTSMRLRDDKPNSDVLEFHYHVKQINSIMARIALVRAMETYLEIRQKYRK